MAEVSGEDVRKDCDDVETHCTRFHLCESLASRAVLSESRLFAFDFLVIVFMFVLVVVVVALVGIVGVSVMVDFPSEGFVGDRDA